MKKLLIKQLFGNEKCRMVLPLLLFWFLIPIAAQANIYSGWHITEEDPCCIYFEFSDSRGDKEVIETLTVVIDGSITYHMSDEYQVYHCFEGNGTHTINFYIDGVLDRSDNIEITDCDGDCTICDIKKIKPHIAQLDGCEYFMDVDWNNVNGTGIYSSECTDPTFFWDYGDGTTYGPSSSQNYFHTFPEDGTYNVCVSFTVINPDGVECTVSKCTEVVVEGCTEVDPCCGYEFGELDYRVFGDCLGWIRQVGYSYSTECGPLTYDWTIDGVAQPATGPSLVNTFDGPGPFVVCLTVTQGSCVFSECITVNLPDCPDGNRSSVSNLGEHGLNWDQNNLEELKIYPNPATDRINIDLNRDLIGQIKMISVVDVKGRVLQTIRVDSNGSNSMDISKLPEGLYFIQMQNEFGTLATDRFIKTN